MAAQYLDPPPRDFIRARALDAAQIQRVVTEGKTGTAMKSFRGLMGQDQIAAVAVFVAQEFVRCRRPNTRYHTVGNGWPRHREQYGAAFPFVDGTLSPETPDAELTAAERAGLRLYRESCVSCHDRPIAPQAKSDGAVRWHVAASAETPNADRHEDDEDEHEDHDEYGYGAADKDAHMQPPEIPDLTPLEVRGEHLYQVNCALCHAADGTGKNWIGRFLEPHPPDLTDPEVRARLDKAAFRTVVLDGRRYSSMPAFRSVLSGEDVDALLAYVLRAFAAPAE